MRLYGEALRTGDTESAASLFRGNLLFSGSLFVAFLPTLITKKIIFGSYANLGYVERWYWKSPALLKVAFSSEHGLFSWTPIAIFAVVGLVFFAKRDKAFAYYALVVFAVYLYVIGCYQDWSGLASFGNRFFVALVSLFCLGLAAFFDRLASLWNSRLAWFTSIASTAILILWNFGMMYQWGTHLIPARGPISWRDAIYNQFAVVPGQAVRTLEKYFLSRSQLMQHIEDEDIKQLRAHPSQ